MSTQMSILGIFGYEDIEHGIDERAYTVVCNHSIKISSIHEIGRDSYTWGISVYEGKDEITRFHERRLMIHISSEGSRLMNSCETEDRGGELEAIASMPDVAELADSLDFTYEESFIKIHNYCAERLSAIMHTIKD